MKKSIIVISLILSLFLGISSIYAYEITADNVVEVSDSVSSSSIIFANNVNTSSKVDGFEIIFANSLNMSSINDYSILFGNNITYKGQSKDMIVFANNFVIEEDGIVDRDIIIFASNVTIKGTIKGKVIIYADSVNINSGNTLENIDAHISTLELNNTTINNLKINEDAEINLNNSTIVNKSLTESTEISEEEDSNIFSDILSSIICNYLIFICLLFIIPKLLVRDKYDYGKIFTQGILYTLLMPIIILILLISVLGFKLSIVLLCLYISSILISTSISGYMLGNVIFNKIIKKNGDNYLKGIVGIIIIIILSNIKYLGILVSIASMIFASGYIINLMLSKRK